MRDVTLTHGEIIYLKQRMRDYTRRGGSQLELQFEKRISHEGVEYYRVNFVGPLGMEYLLDSALYEVHCDRDLVRERLRAKPPIELKEESE